MPVSSLVISKIAQLVVRLAPRAFRGATIVEKVITRKIGQYAIEITRRSSLGRDGGISHIVKVFRGGKTEEIWHMVVRAGKIIHRHME